MSKILMSGWAAEASAKLKELVEEQFKDKPELKEEAKTFYKYADALTMADVEAMIGAITRQIGDIRHAPHGKTALHILYQSEPTHRACMKIIYAALLFRLGTMPLDLLTRYKEAVQAYIAYITVLKALMHAAPIMT